MITTIEVAFQSWMPHHVALQNCGLCNGSQFIVTWLDGDVIGAYILIDAHTRETTFVLRIKLKPTTLKIFFKFSRRQFLVKVVFLW